MKKLILFLLIIASFMSCTDNEMAKNFGGKQEISTGDSISSDRSIIPKNEVILNVTWKENNMWILTRDTITKIVHFREKSEYGVFQCEIIFK